MRENIRVVGSPRGCALILVGWIQIRILIPNANLDPDFLISKIFQIFVITVGAGFGTESGSGSDPHWPKSFDPDLDQPATLQNIYSGTQLPNYKDTSCGPYIGLRTSEPQLDLHGFLRISLQNLYRFWCGKTRGTTITAWAIHSIILKRQSNWMNTLFKAPTK